MQPKHEGACVVCGLRDARALSETRLSGGERAVVCGSHALIHERAKVRARTVPELRTMARERRDRTRRGHEGDELGAILAAAFTAERRKPRDRRA